MPGLLFVSASVGALSYQGVAAYHTSNAETVLILLGWSSGGDQHLHLLPTASPGASLLGLNQVNRPHRLRSMPRHHYHQGFAVGEHHSSTFLSRICLENVMRRCTFQSCAKFQRKGEAAMKTFISIFAVTLALAFTGPAFAGNVKVRLRATAQCLM
ncbi:MAG: hypothetical protein WBQ20_08190, partial [Methyloceanibacter sp.]